MTKNFTDKVAVTSRSFSQHPTLRRELLEKYANVTFNDAGSTLSGSALVEFLKDHSHAITALERIDTALLKELPQLKVIGKYGVGLDMIDLNALDKFGVKLGWTPGVNRRSVSELVISSAITLLHKSNQSNLEVRLGKWRQIRGRQLTQKIFGIIGCGNVGKDLVKLLSPFNCEILVYDIRDYNKFYEDYNIKKVQLDELLRSSDVISIHVPLNESTRGMIDENKLGLLKSDACIINFARGGIIDEVALKKHLIHEKTCAVALDVFLIEPPQDFEFLNLKNLLVTGHIGGSTEEAILAMGRAAIYGLESAKAAKSYADLQ